MISISFSFDHLKILGVVREDVYLQEGRFYDDDTEEGMKDIIIIINRKLFHDSLSVWLNDKESICNRYGHFCGYMGSIRSSDCKYESPVIIPEYNEETDGYEDKEVEVYRMLSFEKDTDMEHG